MEKKAGVIKSCAVFVYILILCSLFITGCGAGSDNKEKESAADIFAENMLIPPDAYQKFLNEHGHAITVQSIAHFANQINRDPGIVLGRLLNDSLIDYRDGRFKTLQKKYKICTKVN